jgi:hypothetical protein
LIAFAVRRESALDQLLTAMHQRNQFATRELAACPTHPPLALLAAQISDHFPTLLFIRTANSSRFSFQQCNQNVAVPPRTERVACAAQRLHYGPRLGRARLRKEGDYELLRSSAPNAQIMNRVGVIPPQNPGHKGDALPQPNEQQLIESRPYFGGRIERFGWRRKEGCCGRDRVQRKPSD